ncbi:MAG TPA: hypothetical protein VK436_02425 [Methanocella sp.]|nr:hypothetical protein [Methanocella sp.]
MNRSLFVAVNNGQQLFSKVPEIITIYFWVTKVLTTGMGEVFSDYLLSSTSHPNLVVVITTLVLVASLALQISVRRYVAWIYWLVVVMVSIFGTMAADVVHFWWGIPLTISTTFFAVSMIIVFITWYALEKTLSIHSICTRRREVFYWLVVLLTFALGTAAGDMTASTMDLGYFYSGVMFTILLIIPAIGLWFFGLNKIAAFWFAYVMTRPVGASFADWISMPITRGGLDVGVDNVSLVLSVIIIILVAYLAITRLDIKKGPAGSQTQADTSANKTG